MEGSGNVVAWPGRAGRNGAEARRKPLIEVRGLTVRKDGAAALTDMTFVVYPSETLVLAGPRGSGKACLLRALNRTLQAHRSLSVDGDIRFMGPQGPEDLAGEPRMGWVGPAPEPITVSIYETLAYAARRSGLSVGRDKMAMHVESCLRQAGLWDGVRGRLHSGAGSDLAPVDRQRLEIARALAGRPAVLLLNDPTRGLDTEDAARIEAVLEGLKGAYALILATSLPQQAERLANRMIFLEGGRIVDTWDRVHGGLPASPFARAFLAADL
ncbi:MAG: hypothetical protein CML68_00345 [Rhodobacteraceae bacterium]|nr:hypothetical protein [Paracoccaceae bacterium]